MENISFLKRKDDGDSVEKNALNGMLWEKHKQELLIMRKIDAPIMNKFPNFDFILNPESLKRARKEWLILKRIYNRIDLSDLSERTGLHIVKGVKEKFEIFDVLFEEYYKNNINREKIQDPSQELLGIQKSIISLANRFREEVPVYKIYRKPGIIEKFDEGGRRLFQIDN